MSSIKAENSIRAAIELGFLTESQLKVIQADGAESKYPATEIAIRRGFLDRQQLDILSVFSDPLGVVPGYRIDGLIGQGGVGVVYKATQVTMDRPVAIKMIKQVVTRNELAPKRFEREAQIVGQLRHPNIVSAFDFGLHGGQMYLVMEFVDGIDAEKYLDQKVKVSEHHAWHIALQVCHALDYANQTGITHRDIKPGNLILTEPPSGTHLPPQVPFVKIADFGLARFKDNEDRPTITMENSMSGTPFYMAPEQITSDEVDHLSDIYALGITIWHLITGFPPFLGSGPLEVIANKMKLEDEWLGETPDDISTEGFELLKKMCRHQREDRISDYQQLVAHVESVIECLKDTQFSNTDDFVVVNEPESQFSASTNVTFVGSLVAFDVDDSGFLTQDESSAPPAESSTGAVFERLIEHRKMLSLMAASLLLMIGVGGFFFSTQPDVQVPSPVAKAEPKFRLTSVLGPPIFLFNGRDVDPRQKFSGVWELSHGEEGESVLAGTNGTRDLKCADEAGDPLRSFIFNCGFRHHDSDIIGFRWIDAAGESLFEATILRDESTLVIGELEVGKIDLEKFGDDSFGYHLFQIESQPGHWRVMVNSKPLGETPKPDGPQGLSTIQMFVKGSGSAHFEQVQFLRLSEETSEAEQAR